MWLSPDFFPFFQSLLAYRWNRLDRERPNHDKLSLFFRETCFRSRKVFVKKQSEANRTSKSFNMFKSIRQTNEKNPKSHLKKSDTTDPCFD